MSHTEPVRSWFSSRQRPKDKLLVLYHKSCSTLCFQQSIVLNRIKIGDLTLRNWYEPTRPIVMLVYLEGILQDNICVRKTISSNVSLLFNALLSLLTAHGSALSIDSYLFAIKLETESRIRI